MKNFLSNVKNIVKSINESPLDKNYFINGGCSNLVNYLTPFFMGNEKLVEFAMFIYAEEEWDVTQINKIMDRATKEKLNELLKEEIILIDHIAIIHNDIIYDGNGFNKKEYFLNKIMLPNNFMRTITFKKEDFVEDFLNTVKGTHIFGHHSESGTRQRIENMLNAKKVKAENFAYY